MSRLPNDSASTLPLVYRDGPLLPRSVLLRRSKSKCGFYSGKGSPETAAKSQSEHRYEHLALFFCMLSKKRNTVKLSGRAYLMLVQVRINTLSLNNSEVLQAVGQYWSIVHLLSLNSKMLLCVVAITHRVLRASATIKSYHEIDRRYNSHFSTLHSVPQQKPCECWLF